MFEVIFGYRGLIFARAGVYFESISPNCAKHWALALVVGDSLGGWNAGHVDNAEHHAAPLFHHRPENRNEGACLNCYGRFQQGTVIHVVVHDIANNQ